jgi:hypothetical protein
MAQAVLLKDVEGLGEAGTAIDVSPGYLRNYLVPRKLAQPATKGALEEAQRRRERAEEAERHAAERAEETTALLSKTVLTIAHRAGEDGKLFGPSPLPRSPRRSRPREGSRSTGRRSGSRSRSARPAPSWSTSRSVADRSPR